MGRLLDINEAVEASGLTERRLRDLLAEVEAGDKTALPGAHKDEEGRRWRIPEESARKLRRRLPLTEEEKKSIRERSQKGWPTKRIVREINAARGQAGDPPISESAVYKFLQMRKQAVPSPPNPTGNASVPGSPGAENREARAQNRGSTRIRVEMMTGEPKSLGGFARISDLKQELGFSEEKTRDLFGLLNKATIENHKFRVSDLRERGFSEEEIRRLFAAFEDAAGDPHELPMREW